MKARPLIETNPYLKDAETRKKLVQRSVKTSCGVEGIKVVHVIHFDIPRRKSKKIYQTVK
jgi:hypothetical protein